MRSTLTFYLHSSYSKIPDLQAQNTSHFELVDLSFPKHFEKTLKDYESFEIQFLHVIREGLKIVPYLRNTNKNNCLDKSNVITT